ncbi:MAG: class I SAM-dependent methyltransferase [Rubrivivax sp.]
MSWSERLWSLLPGGAADQAALAAGIAAHPAARARALLELQERLRRLEALFEIDRIRTEEVDVAAVADYYAACHDAYRKYHSAEGAVHMALNEDGRFDASGFTGQLRRLEAGWAGQAPRDVLEIGFGQGFNLAWLATRHRDTRFTGVDLTPAHVALARARVAAAGLANVQLHEADLHQLPLPDASVDEVFAIEAFCHAIELPRALAEVARVLRPGGRFVLFDAYQARPAPQMEPELALAVELVGRGMAVGRWQQHGEILQEAGRAGLVLQREEALEALVMPSLQRIERVIRAVIRVPWLARRALARRSAARGRNVLAGYLMHPVTALGGLVYRHLVWSRPASLQAAPLAGLTYAASAASGASGASAASPATSLPQVPGTSS